MKTLVGGPWAPGSLHVGAAIIETDPLATWWVDFDQIISDWKQDRVYVDARDVSPATFAHHPAKLLDGRSPRLRALLEQTPALALGEARQARPPPGARVYTVGFVRTADDYFSVRAEGPTMKRTLGAPFLDLEAAMEARHDEHPSREALIDRILAQITDGRLTRRSLDLAEMWSALAGGPSMFFFEGPAERLEYLHVLEASLEEAFARFERHRTEHEAIIAALAAAEASGARRIELPVVGWARREEVPARRLAGKRTRPAGGGVGGVVIDCDGERSIHLAALHRWILEAPTPAFEPEASRAWRAGAAARARRWQARQRGELAASRRAAKRKLLLLLLAALVLVGGPCAHQLRKGAWGDPCRADDDCRAGHCRKHTSEIGVCLSRCSRDGRCHRGRVCRLDAASGRSFCEPARP